MGGYDMNVFKNMHPLPNFFYIISVVVIVMITQNPILCFMSLVCSWLFTLTQTSFIQAVKSLLFYIPLLILIGITNPLFVSKGMTILFYLGGKSFTLESLIYGFSIGAMLVSVLLWFKGYNLTMDSDKSVYLFSKAIPKLSIVITMALRFVPMYMQRFKQVRQTQKTLGLFCNDKLTTKIKNNLSVFFAVFAWSIEKAIDTADSMKARAYGTRKRVCYNRFKFSYKDVVFLIVSMICCGSIIALFCLGLAEYSFYPYMSQLYKGVGSLILYILCGAYMLLPVVMEIKEEMKWKYLKLKS